MNTKEVFASEQGHWYERDGTPRYEVPCKSRPGEMRNTTIKDARQLDLVPSVSGILKVMGKGDQLVNWCKKQVADTAFDVGASGNEESRDEWCAYILKVAEERMSAQREKGSRDHGIVEEYFRQLSYLQREVRGLNATPLVISLPVKAVLAAFRDLRIAGQPIDSEKSFACDLDYGGKIDVSGISDGLNTDGLWIVDFKFVDRLEKKKDYVEKVAQGAAYLYGKWGDRGLAYGRFANIFVETTDYNYEVREWTHDEIQHGWEVFAACLRLWKTLNKF